MKASSLNHVSISAPDLDASVRFYRDVFGLEEIPTPNFGFPVRWLRIGDLQLHLFHRPGDAPPYHHVGLTVDDFEAVYLTAREMGIIDGTTFGYHLFLLPNDNVQLYLRDPGGNLIEIDWPDVNTLSPRVTDDIRPLPQRQEGDNLKATLFLKAAAAERAER